MLALNPGLQVLHTVGSETQLIQLGSVHAKADHARESKRVIMMLAILIMILYKAILIVNGEHAAGRRKERGSS